MGQKLYVTAATSRKEWAEGYAAGLEASAQDYFEEVVYEVVLADDFPLDKVCVTSKPITGEFV